MYDTVLAYVDKTCSKRRTSLRLGDTTGNALYWRVSPTVTIQRNIFIESRFHPLVFSEGSHPFI